MRVSKPVLLLASGHFCVDLYSSMLGAFLPFLQQKLDISLAEAGLLAGALVFSSSLAQPIYGLLADRLRSKAFVALGPAVAAIFISFLGLAPGFRTMFVLLILGGVGVAAYHPQAAALTHRLSRTNHSFQMSVFVTAGTVGYALGPLYITVVIGQLGLEQSYWAAIPGVLLTLFLVLRAPSPQQASMDRPVSLKDQLRGFVKPLAILYALVVIRSVISAGFSSFLPLFYTTQGYTPATANVFLTIFLFAGGAAGLAGGLLADRFGGKRVTGLSFLVSTPLFIGFVLTDGLVSVALSAVASAFLLFSGPVNIVMAQRLVPRGASTIAALMMGFAWGTAGLLVPPVGALFEWLGFSWTFAILALLALPGFALALMLPADHSTERRPANAQIDAEIAIE
jgi:FSR family fosmidomycin resistance protein-like MFS transporter